MHQDHSAHPAHLNPLRVHSKPHQRSTPSSPLQEIIVVIPPPAGCSDLFVVAQRTANGVAQCPIETAFSIESVGLTAGSYEAVFTSQ